MRHNIFLPKRSGMRNINYWERSIFNRRKKRPYTFSPSLVFNRVFCLSYLGVPTQINKHERSATLRVCMWLSASTYRIAGTSLCLVVKYVFLLKIYLTSLHISIIYQPIPTKSLKSCSKVMA